VKRTASELLPELAIVSRAGYVGPSVSDRRKDYQKLYEEVASGLEKERSRVQAKFSKKLGPIKSPGTKTPVKSKFKAPSPGFGMAPRFQVEPPSNIFHLNMPGPGSYDQNKIFDIGHCYGDGTPRFDKRVSTKKKGKRKKKKGRKTSSFAGKGRDTMKYMARYGKAPAIDNPSGNDYRPTPMQFLSESANIRAFRPSKSVVYNKKAIKRSTRSSPSLFDSLSTSQKGPRASRRFAAKKLKPKTLEEMAWYSRGLAPNLANIQDRFSVKKQESAPVLLEKFNLGQMHKAFFDETKVIKSGKKKNDWEMR
jgi:hypothetical protein